MNAITKIEEPNDPIAKLNHQLAVRAQEFKKVLPAGITPEKLQRVVVTAAQNNPDILSANRQSLMVSCMKAAQDGLVPDGREAALVPFKKNYKEGTEWKSMLLVQYMPMVYGLRKKILQSGEIKDIQTAIVYRQEIENGLFVYEEGTERMLRHRPLLDPDFAPTDADIAAAYSVATFADGSKSFEVMRRGEINKVREKSQTGATKDNKGKPRTPSGPWVDWYSEMARKTVMRRHSKTLPMSGDIIDVEALDETLAASATTEILGSVEEAGPTTAILPPHDAQTGEIIDQQQVENEPSEEEREAAEAADRAAYRQMEGEAQDDDEIPAWTDQVEDWKERLRTAELIADVGAVVEEINTSKITPDLPPKVVEELAQADKQARARLKGTAK
jgi:recombination protein RecT